MGFQKGKRGYITRHITILYHLPSHLFPWDGENQTDWKASDKKIYILIVSNQFQVRILTKNVIRIMSENKKLLKKLFDHIKMGKMENIINVKKLLLKLKMDFYLQFIGCQMTDRRYYCNMVYWNMF